MNPLRIGLIITLGILLSGIIFLRLWPAKYTVSLDKSLTTAEKMKGITEQELNSLIESSDNKTKIVDIRHASDFSKSHIKNAINIPAEEIYKRKNLKKLGNYKVVIYGSKAYEANQAALLLVMSGVNAKPANVDYQLAGKDSSTSGLISALNDTIYNYREFFKAFEIQEPAPVVIKVPVPKPQGC